VSTLFQNFRIWGKKTVFSRLVRKITSAIPLDPNQVRQVEELRSLRRRARAAYATDCESECYLVQNMLLELNPPDKFIPFIEDLTRLLAENSHRLHDGFLNVGKKFFEKYFHSSEYTAALEWLEKNGIIIRPDPYSTGTDTVDAFAKAIKITDEAHLSGYSVVKLRVKKKDRSKPEERPDNFVQRYVDIRHRIDIAPGALSENERIFNQAMADAQLIANMVERNKAIVIAQSNRATFQQQIRDTRSENWWAKRDASGRVYFPYASLSSSIRSYLTIDGVPTVSLDASNLHPAILERLLKDFAAMSVEAIMELLAKWDRTPNKQNTRARKIVPDSEYRGDKSEVSKSKYQAELRERAVALKKAAQEGLDEINEFGRLTSTSSLYEVLRKKVGHSSLKEVKTIILSCLNEKSNATHGNGLERRVRIAFREMFPFIHECLRQIKKETHGSISVALTLKESEIFEHPVVNALDPVRIHDSVRVKESLADKMMDALRYSLGAARVNTTIKVEDSTRLFTQDTPPASEWQYDDGWVRNGQRSEAQSYEQFLTDKEQQKLVSAPDRELPEIPTEESPLPLCAAKSKKNENNEPRQFRTNRPIRHTVNRNSTALDSTKARPPP